MLIKEVTSPHKLNKLDIKPDDLRYPLYVPAIEKYSDSNTSRKLSNYLHQLYRNPKTSSKKNKELTQMLDDIMFNHPIKQNVTLYHGSRESPIRIWVKYNVPANKSVTVHFPGFISSSTNKNIAKKFGRSDFFKQTDNKYIGKRNVLIIEVPAGTPGLSVKQFSKFEAENEILLARGLDIKIYPYPKIEGDFVYWRAKVAGHTPQEIVE
jgi:hypothetical protein